VLHIMQLCRLYYKQIIDQLLVPVWTQPSNVSQVDGMALSNRV